MNLTIKDNKGNKRDVKDPKFIPRIGESIDFHYDSITERGHIPKVKEVIYDYEYNTIIVYAS